MNDKPPIILPTLTVEQVRDGETCPRCTAPVGVGCVRSPAERAKGGNHIERVRAYRDARRRPPATR